MKHFTCHTFVSHISFGQTAPVFVKDAAALFTPDFQWQLSHQPWSTRLNDDFSSHL